MKELSSKRPNLSHSINVFCTVADLENMPPFSKNAAKIALKCAAALYDVFFCRALIKMRPHFPFINLYSLGPQISKPQASLCILQSVNYTKDWLKKDEELPLPLTLCPLVFQFLANYFSVYSFA